LIESVRTVGIYGLRAVQGSPATWPGIGWIHLLMREKDAKKFEDGINQYLNSQRVSFSNLFDFFFSTVHFFKSDLN